MSESESTALVLAGGGARGAYEAGVLSVLLPVLEERGERPTIFVGTSVGAINAAFVASCANLRASDAMEAGLEAWRKVDKGEVIEPVAAKQGAVAVAQLASEAIGVPGAHLSGLLDPSPLGKNLRDWIDWEALHANVRDGTVEALAAVTTATHTGRTVVFYESASPIDLHCPHVVDYVPARLSVEHVRASAAIPVAFPPVRIDEPEEARAWYVDGGTRFNAPIKPAIDIGATRLAVVGTTALTERLSRATDPDPDAEPGVTDGALQLVHGALVDPLIEDIRTLASINSFYVGEGNGDGARRLREAAGKDPYRLLPYLYVGPERTDAIGKLAAEVFRERYGGIKALRSLDFGALNAIIDADSVNHGELLSYLFFDPEFIEELIQMGRRDATAQLAAAASGDELWKAEPIGLNGASSARA
jgi:NTE family protein